MDIMYNKAIRLSVLFCLLGFAFAVSAHVGPRDKEEGKKKAQYRMDCSPSAADVDLEINNVRARLQTGGDLFWDFDNGRYIVPKRDPGSGIEEVSSIFAAAVWLGGVLPNEVGGGTPSLKLACQDYRPGVDFYPGPLTEDTGETDAETCRNWDQFFNVKGDSIAKHIAQYNLAVQTGQEYDEDLIPEDLKRWPAPGNPFFNEFYDFSLPNTRQGLGNFHDANLDDIYNPLDGDYPVIDIRGCPDPQYPDDMYFWVYNDNGGEHETTSGDPIRMEIQVQAFGYQTQDEINDMTFYRYKLVNRAAEPIDSTFFAMWVDADLGCPDDDYIGCDSTESLMYVYNEDAVDGINDCDCTVGGEIIPTYCTDVPILGVDYFRGPLSEPREQPDGTFKAVDLGMTSFSYYNRTGSQNPPGTEDPTAPNEYYRILNGFWRDGNPVTIGGNGYLSGSQITRYAFPFAPDFSGGWSMCEDDLIRGDRRTVQATGPFRLNPGAINELIIGVVWLETADYPCPSIDPLLRADQTAQGLFDACFNIQDGPDAPTMFTLELDQEIVFTLANDRLTSNNVGLSYSEPGINIPGGTSDSLYVFEGYRVFQLATADVTAIESNFEDTEKAREVAKFDLVNGVTELYNWEPISDPVNGGTVWIPEVKAEGLDEGISHSFSLTQDAFASGEDTRLVNFKEYFYTVIAYGYNNYADFTPGPPELGQEEPYIPGNGNVREYTVVPRKTAHIDLMSIYGEGLEVTRLDGDGVATNLLMISDETREEIALNGSVGELTFLPGSSPIRAKVYDPVHIQDGSYILTFDDYSSDPTLENTTFSVRREGDSEPAYTTDGGISQLNEHLINNYGFSVTLGQVDEPGTNPFQDPSNGFLGAAVEYADPLGSQWFSFVPEGGSAPIDFIKTDREEELIYQTDPNEVYTTQFQTGFYPFLLTAFDTNNIEGLNTIQAGNLYFSPGWFNSDFAQVRGNVNGLENLNNVDIVFTSNKDLWSRCIAVQSSNYAYEDFIDEDEQSMDLLRRPSVTKEASAGNPNIPADDLEATGDDAIGYVYFPGYAVDVETGKRVNIFFGENTYFDPENKNLGLAPNPFYNGFDLTAGFDYRNIDSVADNFLRGNDRMWNPNEPGVHDAFMAGGLQYIYVTNLEYDGCEKFHDTLLQVADRPDIFQRITKKNMFKFISWAGFPVMAQDEALLSYEDGLIPNDYTVSLRVKNSFQQEEHTSSNDGFNEYRILVENKMAQELDEEGVENALDLINVVPNPYYSYSVYEKSATQNIVKITNLPQVATVTIYSLDGRFIRRYDQNAEDGSVGTISNAPVPNTLFDTDIEWDLKNDNGIPISSGVYFIHVEAPGLGERIIKWFGVNRKFDPSAL